MIVVLLLAFAILFLQLLPVLALLQPVALQYLHLLFLLQLLLFQVVLSTGLLYFYMKFDANTSTVLKNTRTTVSILLPIGYLHLLLLLL